MLVASRQPAILGNAVDERFGAPAMRLGICGTRPPTRPTRFWPGGNVSTAASGIASLTVTAIANGFRSPKV